MLTSSQPPGAHIRYPSQETDWTLVMTVVPSASCRYLFSKICPTSPPRSKRIGSKSIDSGGGLNFDICRWKPEGGVEEGGSSHVSRCHESGVTCHHRVTARVTGLINIWYILIHFRSMDTVVMLWCALRLQLCVSRLSRVTQSVTKRDDNYGLIRKTGSASFAVMCDTADPGASLIETKTGLDWRIGNCISFDSFLNYEIL